MPINAIPFDRFSKVVESAMYACAVDIVAPEIPAPRRLMNSKSKLSFTVATPNKK